MKDKDGDEVEVKKDEFDNAKKNAKSESFKDEEGDEYYKEGDKYYMKSEDGKKVDIDKEDYEEMKQHSVNVNNDETDDDVKNSKFDGDEPEDDEQDEKGNSKKDPKKVWKPKTYKRGNKTFRTKSYYNKKGDSISAKEYKERVAKYNKQKNESMVYFLKNKLVVEGKRTINLSQYIKNRI